MGYNRFFGSVGLQPNPDIKLQKLKCNLLTCNKKNRIVLDLFRGEDSLAAICRREVKLKKG